MMALALYFQAHRLSCSHVTDPHAFNLNHWPAVYQSPELSLRHLSSSTNSDLHLWAGWKCYDSGLACIAMYFMPRFGMYSNVFYALQMRSKVYLTTDAISACSDLPSSFWQ